MFISEKGCKNIDLADRIEIIDMLIVNVIVKIVLSIPDCLM